MSFDFDPFDAVLLDLDGTIYRHEHPLPGAVELIARLEREGRPYACLSNTTATPERVVRRLGAMGMSMAAEHVYTASAAAADYVLERWPRPRVFNLTGADVDDLLAGRVDWIGPDAPACDAVIVGTPMNTHATPERTRAALAFLRGGAALVGTSADRVYPSMRGLEFGAGALAAMLAYAAHVEPIFTGKPQALFFRKLCEAIGVNPAKCVLIGDNLESDIQGANGVGMRTILTLTGVTRRADLVALGDARPDWVVDDLTALDG